MIPPTQHASACDKYVNLDVQVPQVRRLQDLEISNFLKKTSSSHSLAVLSMRTKEDAQFKRIWEYLESKIFPENEGNVNKIAAQARNCTIVDVTLHFVDVKRQNLKCAAVPSHLQVRIPQKNHRQVMASHFYIGSEDVQYSELLLVVGNNVLRG